VRERVAFLEQDRLLAPDIQAMSDWALGASWPAPVTALLPSRAA
jgi:histidine ammonia-lyase